MLNVELDENLKQNIINELKEAKNKINEIYSFLQEKEIDCNIIKKDKPITLDRHVLICEKDITEFKYKNIQYQVQSKKVKYSCFIGLTLCDEIRITYVVSIDYFAHGYSYESFAKAEEDFFGQLIKFGSTKEIK